MRKFRNDEKNNILDFRLDTEAKTKEDSEKWNKSQWEQHLKTIESNSKEASLGKAHFCKLLSNQAHEERWGIKRTDALGESVKRRLCEAMAALPEKHRQCLHLIFWEGLTLNDTARRLGVCLKTVKRWKAKALEDLRFHLSISNPKELAAMGADVGLTRRETFVVKHRMGIVPEREVRIPKREENKLYKSATEKLEEYRQRNQVGFHMVG